MKLSMKRASDHFPSPLGRGVKGRGTVALDPHPYPPPTGEGARDQWRFACSRILNQTATWSRWAQLAVVLLCALALKVYYSTASADQLRWILAPTTALVELVSGTRFAFESHAGYINSERTFIIASACAGVNFLLTAFLMLSLRRLWRARTQKAPSYLAWRFIPAAAVAAYVATLVANTVRISVALWLKRTPLGISWLSRDQLHRVEGIFVYFGFLLLLFVISEKLNSKSASNLPPHAGCRRGKPSLLRQSVFPLIIYYVIALGIPLANGVYHREIAATAFWEHSAFVLLIPLLLMIPLATFRVYRDHWARSKRRVCADTQTT